jgi:hypothetical protein
VLAGERERLGADPPGQGRHAGLDPVTHCAGRRPRLHLRYLRAGDHHYIIGEKLRSRSAQADAALSPAGPLPGCRREPAVKEVRIAEDERFVICYNPEAAERDTAVRARMLA